jgi:hypothetical protein
METIQKREAWNKGKLIGQKPPLRHPGNRQRFLSLQTAQETGEIGLINWKKKPSRWTVKPAEGSA